MKTGSLVILIVAINLIGSIRNGALGQNCQGELTSLADKYMLFNPELEVYNQMYFQNELELAELYRGLVMVVEPSESPLDSVFIVEAFASRTLEMLSIGSFFVDLKNGLIGKPRIIFPDNSGIGMYKTTDVPSVVLANKEVEWLASCLNEN